MNIVKTYYCQRRWSFETDTSGSIGMRFEIKVLNPSCPNVDLSFVKFDYSFVFSRNLTGYLEKSDFLYVRKEYSNIKTGAVI